MNKLLTRNKPGFTIIECLTYCLLIGFFATTVIPALLRLSISLVRLQNNGRSMIEASVATDVFYRDLVVQRSRLSLMVVDWQNLIWQVDGTRSIGWSFEDNTLMRTEGSYEARVKKWRNSTSSVLCRNLVEGRFIVNQSKRPMKVEIQLKFSDGSFERVVWV